MPIKSGNKEKIGSCRYGILTRRTGDNEFEPDIKLNRNRFKFFFRNLRLERPHQIAQRVNDRFLSSIWRSGGNEQIDYHGYQDESHEAEMDYNALPPRNQVAVHFMPSPPFIFSLGGTLPFKHRKLSLPYLKASSRLLQSFREFVPLYHFISNFRFLYFLNIIDFPRFRIFHTLRGLPS